jgi:hypothetical protein
MNASAELSELLEASASRKVLPFLGAGFSKNVSSDLPTWHQLTESAARLLGFDGPILKAQADQYQIAEYLELRNELGRFYSDLNRSLHKSTYRIEDSKVHAALCQLDAEYIFTTNWDNWIENAFEYSKIPCQKVVGVDGLINPKQIGAADSVPPAHKQFPATTVVKFHGDFDDQKELVFKETDYHRRLDFRHPLDIKLQAEALCRSVVFIGYSFTDKNTRYIWHRLREARASVLGPRRPRSFFVTFSNNELQRAVFHSMEISTIVLDRSDPANNLDALFNELLRVQGA